MLIKIKNYNPCYILIFLYYINYIVYKCSLKFAMIKASPGNSFQNFIEYVDKVIIVLIHN